MGSSFRNKQLMGEPWRLAFALQDDGWILRSEIIWHKCLSGGTRVYAQTQKGEMPMTVKDMVRLDPATVKLWDGEKWNQAVAWEEVERQGNELEIELRSGERIGCTREHRWPTQRGLVTAQELHIGDVITSALLPEPKTPRTPKALLSSEVGWFVGLYLAEGSLSDGTIQIASHLSETRRFERLQALAAEFDGYCFKYQASQNGMTLNVNSPILLGVLRAYISGHTAKRKHLHVRCWQRDNAFLRAVLEGYLEGDGCQRGPAHWALAFTVNDSLVADLRTLSARLGYSLRLRRRVTHIGKKPYPCWRGDLRTILTVRRSPDSQIVAIRKSRARKFWHVMLRDEPHTFCLASGVCTKNSNPMPESVRDRPTKAHETVFLLTKAARYYYDADAVREPAEYGRRSAFRSHNYEQGRAKDNQPSVDGGTVSGADPSAGRNRRTVWTIPTAAFPGAHFACVSDDTECLTIDGWKRYEELRQGQLLAAYNLATGRLRWEPLNAVAVYDYAGEMVKVGGQSLGVLCTPNHRCITKTVSGRVRIRRADALTNNLKVPCAADWEQGTYGFSDDPHPVVAELLGWTVTDGHFNGSSTVITQSLTANGPKVERIEELLMLAGFHYKKYIRHRGSHPFPNGAMSRECEIVHFSITKDGDRVLKGYLSLAKRIPPSAVLWSIESIQALFAGIVGGDGNIREDGRIQIVQKDREFIDWTQILALRLGYRAIVSKRKRGWCVFLVKRRWLGLRTSKGSNVTRVPYDGKVWCPSLPSGTFVARRNGRVWITGNTFPPKLIEPMILTSPTKCCAMCGQGWERVTERGELVPDAPGYKPRGNAAPDGFVNVGMTLQGSDQPAPNHHYEMKQLGFRPACDCGSEETVPATVLDPFVGSGTSVMVALRHGRNAIGLELSEEYAAMARRRINDDCPMFNGG
jgi:hypothetical protein